MLRNTASRIFECRMRRQTDAVDIPAGCPLVPRLMLLAGSRSAQQRTTFCLEVAQLVSSPHFLESVHQFLGQLLTLLDDPDATLRAAAAEATKVLTLSLIHEDPEEGYDYVYSSFWSRLVLKPSISDTVIVSLATHARASERVALLLRLLAPSLSGLGSVFVGVLPLLPSDTIQLFFLPMALAHSDSDKVNDRIESPAVLLGLLKHYLELPLHESAHETCSISDAAARVLEQFIRLCADGNPSVRIAAVQQFFGVLGFLRGSLDQGVLSRGHDPIKSLLPLLSSTALAMACDSFPSVVQAAISRAGFWLVEMQALGIFHQKLWEVFLDYLDCLGEQDDPLVLQSFPAVVGALGGWREHIWPAIKRLKDRRQAAACLLQCLANSGLSLKEPLDEVYQSTPTFLSSCDVATARSGLQIFQSLGHPNNMACALALNPQVKSWRKRLFIAEEAMPVIVGSARSDCGAVDLQRHAILPLWTALLIDEVDAVRSAAAANAHGIFHMLKVLPSKAAKGPTEAENEPPGGNSAATNPERNRVTRLGEHLVFWFTGSRSTASNRKTFLKVFKSISGSGGTLKEAFQRLRNDPVVDVRIVWEDVAKVLCKGIDDEDSNPTVAEWSSSSPTDVDWIFDDD